MSTLILTPFFLVVIGLAGWTITTYLVKEDSKTFIKEELMNLLDICKMFFVSLKSLIEILAKYSFTSDSIEGTPMEESLVEESPFDSFGLQQKSLQVVDPIEAVETTGTIPSMKVVEADTELSSFSPELVEVITEEEENVA